MRRTMRRRQNFALYRARVALSTSTDATTWRAMSLRARIETVVILAVFVLYVAFFLKLLIFSREPGAERSLNLIPFASITEYAGGGTAGLKRFAWSNVVGNILLFVPLGAYLPVLRARVTLGSGMLLIAAVSVGVEIVQGVFGLGASDVDDVILNCLGGLIGMLFTALLLVVLRRRSRVRTAIAVLSLFAVPVLYELLFVIQLRM